MAEQEKDGGTRPGRRCSICGITYNFKPQWTVCAQCGEKTEGISNGSGHMDDAEATKILRHREYEEWCERMGRKP